MLTHTEVGRFEHRSSDGDVGAVRRPFFDWLECRSSVPIVREELLDLVTSVVDELAAPSPIGFTIIAEDGGDNVLLLFHVEGSVHDLPSRLGRGLAAVDRMAHRLSVDVVPSSGDRYVLLDVSLPAG